MHRATATKRLLAVYWLLVTLVAFTVITGTSTSPAGIQLTATSAATSSSNPSTYVGAEQCASCHPKQYATWKQSYHNNTGLINITAGIRYYWLSPAWLHNGSTRKMSQTDFARCARCHVTGYDSKTGTWPGWNSTDPAVAGKLLGVQCEVCHGPGMTMSINYSSTLCGQCHTQPKDLKLSAHNDSLPTMLASTRRADRCLKCHSTQGFLGENVTLATTGLESISCVTCHSPHNATNEYQLRQETPIDTCGKCHDYPPRHATSYTLFIEGPHEKAGLECTSCHGQGTRLRYGIAQPWFNHTFWIYNTYYPYTQADPMVCTRCHTQSWATTQLGIIQGTVEEVIANVTTAINNANTAITTANQTSGVDKAKITQATTLSSTALSWVRYVNGDRSSGFHNPEKTYELLSEAWRLAGQAEALAKTAQQEAISKQLSGVQGQLATTQMYLYVGVVGAIIGGLIIGLLVGRRWSTK